MEEYWNQTMITSSVASAVLILCGYESDVQPNATSYTIYIAPFDYYAEPNPEADGVFFPNLTCSLEPLLTKSTVQYTSVDQNFAILQSPPLAKEANRAPSESVNAIWQIYSLAVSSWVCCFIFVIVLSHHFLDSWHAHDDQVINPLAGKHGD